MRWKYLLIAILTLTSLCFSRDSSHEGSDPVAAIRQSLGPSCVVIEPVTIADRGQYASVTVLGTSQEMYSPELGANDRLLVTRETPKGILKLARKSGFRVEETSEQEPIPRVLPLSGDAPCPSVAEATRIVAEERTRRRRELQSKLHRPGDAGVTLPKPLDSAKSGKQASGAPTSPAPNAKNEEKKGTSGTVYLSVVVGADGTVQQLKVVRSLTSEMDEKAVEEVKRWTFAPAREKGLPVPVVMQVEVNFHLH